MKNGIHLTMEQGHTYRKKSKPRKRIVGVLLVLATGIMSLKMVQSPLFQEIKDEVFSAYHTMKNTVLGSPVQTDWQLLLVNRWNPIPKGLDVALVTLSGGHQIDERIYPELQEMFDDARADGILPMIYSSYRTTQKQQRLMDEEISKYQQEGHSYLKAKKIAETWVAKPGTSEHQIGLALDITSADKEIQKPEIVWEWLRKNSYQYGFILRYPENKTDITGISSEPWHFRYVGKTAATEIYKRDICLEEYLERIDR